MNDTMPSGEDPSDPDQPEEEAQDDAGSGEARSDDDGSADDRDEGGSEDAGSDGGADETADQGDRQLAKVAGSDPPDPKKLDEVDERIRHARSTAEEVVGGNEDQPDYPERGEEQPEDDRPITPAAQGDIPRPRWRGGAGGVAAGFGGRPADAAMAWPGGVTVPPWRATRSRTRAASSACVRRAA